MNIRKRLTRAIGHQQDGFQGKWDNSGAIEHSLTCNRQFNWIHPKTIARENDYRKEKCGKRWKLRRQNTIKR